MQFLIVWYLRNLFPLLLISIVLPLPLGIEASLPHRLSLWALTRLESGLSWPIPPYCEYLSRYLARVVLPVTMKP